MTESVIHESFDLARQIRAERNWRYKLISFYWMRCFRLTKLLEQFIRPNARSLASKRVMNYGCGNKFYDQAINVDLFAPHRFLLGKRKPDLYWSGTVPVPELTGCLDGVVCEHVIEHILPDDVQGLLSNFRSVLNDNGVFVVSFPDIGKVLSGGLCQGYATKSASVNALIYRHGHCFMYDTDLVVELLRSAGFEKVRAEKFDDLPLMEFIGPGRADESSYVVAECGGSSSL